MSNPKQPLDEAATADQRIDAPLQLAPDDPEEAQEEARRLRRRKRAATAAKAAPSNDETVLDRPAPVPEAAPARASRQPAAASRGGNGLDMSDALRWTLDSISSPSMAWADWLARDIDATQPSATALLTNPAITLRQVRQAKSVFKTMRIVGEKSADRRVGARMYAAAIAAGVVRFGKKVTTQSDEALRRGFQGLLDDRRMPAPLRDLAGMALCKLTDLNLSGVELPRQQRPAGESLSPGDAA